MIDQDDDDYVDVRRVLRGLRKKHGASVEVVVKYVNAAGKTSRLQGHLVETTEETITLRNAAWTRDRYLAFDEIVDAWKHGSK